jgi:flagellar M-ring protein FliF
VSLLVDSDVRWEGSGAKARRILEPPSAEKLKAIHDLVAGVIGFSAERGDQLVVETLPFESTRNPEPLSLTSNPSTPPPPANWMNEILKSKYFFVGTGVGLALFVVLLFIVVRLARGGARAAPSIEMAAQLAAPAGPTESLQKQIENQLAEQSAQRQKQESEALSALKLPPVTKKTEVLTKHIAEQAKKDSASMAHVLRAWMSDGGEDVRR